MQLWVQTYFRAVEIYVRETPKTVCTYDEYKTENNLFSYKFVIASA